MTRPSYTLFGERDPDEIDAPRWHVERVDVRAIVLDRQGPAARPAVEGEIDPEVRPLADAAIPAAALLRGLDEPQAPALLPAPAPLEALPEPEVYAPPPVIARPVVPPPPRTGPRVEVWHGQPTTPLVRGTCIVAALTDETRDPIWWRSVLPGVGFEITIWPDGAPLEGQKHAPREVLGPFGPDQIIREPVQRIEVQLPDGRVKSLPVTMVGGKPRIIVSALDIMPAPPTEKVGMPAHLRDRSMA